jgi:hypothetical protein
MLPEKDMQNMFNLLDQQLSKSCKNLKRELRAIECGK